MEVAKDQPSTGETKSAKLLRYPLRSGTKPKEDAPTPSSSKRGRPASNVSKSVSVLDLSGKEKSAKPPRRLSIPAKSAISPLPRPTAAITPISESRMKPSTSRQGKNGTPASDVSKSMNQRKFSVLSSASYWLSQIKLSETAAKHSISLGFFKLALESGCEPLHRLRDELKSYAGRHNLAELGDPVTELLRSYDISEDLEELQVSVTCSNAPEEGTRSSEEEIHSSSAGAGKFKPKSLNSEIFQVSVSESAKKGSKKLTPVAKSRVPSNTNPSLKSASNSERANIQKKVQKPSNKQDTNKEKPKPKEEGKKSDVEKGLNDPLPAEKVQQEDKENMDAEQLEEINLAEVV